MYFLMLSNQSTVNIFTVYFIVLTRAVAIGTHFLFKIRSIRDGTQLNRTYNSIKRLLSKMWCCCRPSITPRFMQAYPLMWNECAFDTIRTPGVSVSAVTLRVEPDCSGQRICSQIIYVNFSFLPSTPLPVRAKPIENQTRGEETAENRTIRYRAWHELRQTRQDWGLVVGIDRWLLDATKNLLLRTRH